MGIKLLQKTYLCVIITEADRKLSGSDTPRYMKHDNRQSEDNTSPVLSAFRRMRQSLQRMAGGMLGDEAEAEDALQDAFCRLWPRRGSIRSEDEAAALLTTTVRHLSIDVLRRRRTACIVPIAEEHDTGEPADASEREACYRRVEAIVERHLSPLQREILHRREYDGESFESIAASLGMQTAAVRMQLSRIRKTIRELYRNDHDE